VFWIPLSHIFLILRRIRRSIIINTNRPSCTVLNILLRLQIILNLFGRFSKIFQISKFLNIVQYKPNFSSRTEGRIYRTDEVNAVFFAVLWIRLKTDITSRGVRTSDHVLYTCWSLADTGSGHRLLISSSRSGIWQLNNKKIYQLL